MEQHLFGERLSYHMVFPELAQASVLPGLYGERVGALTVVTKQAAVAKRVDSQLKQARHRLQRGLSNSHEQHLTLTESFG